MHLKEHLARRTRRNIRTSRTRLPARHLIPTPRPIRARATATQDINISARALHSARNPANREPRNRHARRRRPRRAAVLVVLLDDDAVLGDARQRDVLVGDVLDGARRVVDGLDAHAVLRVFDGGGRYGYRRYVVVGAPAYAAN